ncbi:hypothetical protein F5Y12DRAFT_205824 [Xylaria sp. FL1777]|nr:hypothetical protein F5Y12DRAFT_205824 [Xylaria sp. FL1777]
MGSRGRVIQAVPNEIVLLIAGYMDITTLSCFMATSKGINVFVKYHERSISKKRAATFTLPPLGAILSSCSDERHVIPKNSFAMLLELERRDIRIDRMIKERPKKFCIPSPPWLPSLTPLGQIRLVPIIKRALHQCDRIADIAANEWPIPPGYYRNIPDGVYELPEALIPPTTQLSKFNPLTNPRARPKQIEYIQSLSLEDVTGLMLLLNMLGHGIMSHCTSATHFERMVVMEECILRHGTWFLWARLSRKPSLLELAIYIMSGGRAEASYWESGDITDLAGLKMTLLGQFKKLLGGETHNEFAERIPGAFKTLLRGDDKGGKLWVHDFDYDD